MNKEASNNTYTNVMEWEDCKPEFCLNCNALFEEGFDPVRQISVSFHKYSDSEEDDEAEDERKVSILDALSSVFVSGELVQLQKSTKAFDLTRGFSMCFKCAQTMSHLYEAYIELLTFSDPAARISKLVPQVELWHHKKGIFLPEENEEVKDEVNTDFENDQEHSLDYQDTVPMIEFGDSNSSCIVEVKKEWDSGSDSEDQSSEADPVEQAVSVRKTVEAKQIVRRSARIPLRGEIDTKKTSETLQPDTKDNSSKRKKPSAKADIVLPPVSSSSEKRPADDPDDYFPPRPKKEQRERSKPRGFVFCPESNCNKKYHFKWRIEQHILEDHQHKKPTQCKKCSFKYFDKERYKEHHCIIRQDRYAQKLHFRCEYCGQAFDKKTRCNQHASTHDHQNLVKCPVKGCPRRYRIPEHLEKHMKVAHKDGNVKKQERAQCQICGQFYANARQVVRHMETHNSEKPYLCGECGKSFIRSMGLKNHMLTHTSERKYQCPLCNVCFKRPTHLTAHYKSRTHEDQPEKIAELMKQGNRQNVKGPVLIPPKYKFKNHHMWAKGRRRTTNSTSKISTAAQEQIPRTSSSNDDPTEIPASESDSSSGTAVMELSLETPRSSSHFPEISVPGPSVQPMYTDSNPFSKVNFSQFYDHHYPNY